MLVSQLEEGRAEVENQYSRSVSYAGNLPAQAILREVFEVSNRKWRGIGAIAESGLRLRDEYAAFDAERSSARNDVTAGRARECISALVLQGLRKPHDCPAFGSRCHAGEPARPPMVSTEGACALITNIARHA